MFSWRLKLTNFSPSDQWHVQCRAHEGWQRGLETIHQAYQIRRRFRRSGELIRTGYDIMTRLNAAACPRHTGRSLYGSPVSKIVHRRAQLQMTRRRERPVWFEAGSVARTCAHVFIGVCCCSPGPGNIFKGARVSQRLLWYHNDFLIIAFVLLFYIRISWMLLICKYEKKLYQKYRN